MAPCRKKLTKVLKLFQYQRLEILPKVVQTAFGKKLGKKVLKKNQILLNMTDKDCGPVQRVIFALTKKIPIISYFEFIDLLTMHMASRDFYPFKQH